MMENISYIIEYYLFIKWFERSYPSMFRQCVHNIGLPGGDYGVVISRNNLDNTVYTALLRIRKQYYSLAID